MKKICLLFCCMSALSTFAQQQDGKKTFSSNTEKKAVITAHIDNLPNDTLAILFEPYTGEYDTMRVKDHRLKFEMPMKKGGSIYAIKVGDANETVNNIKVVYVEDGFMHLTGPALNKTKVTGSKWAKEWEEVFVLVDGWKEGGLANKLNGLRESIRKAEEVGDEDASITYSHQYDSLSQIQKKKILEWIRKNPNSGVTGYLITCFIPKKEEKDSLIATLGAHAKESRILQRYLHPGKVDEAPVSVKFNNKEEANAQFNAVPNGKPAPVFNIPDVNGKMINLADFKGKYVLLDFWASWCSPCKGQVPFLKAANDKFKSKNMVVLGISLDSKKDAWMKAIESEGLNWLNASNLKGWAEPVAGLYGAAAIPYNVLIGPDGTILAQGLYGEDIDKKLSEIIK